MVYYSEKPRGNTCHKGHHVPTTQNMNIMHLKTQGIRQHVPMSALRCPVVFLPLGPCSPAAVPMPSGICTCPRVSQPFNGPDVTSRGMWTTGRGFESRWGHDALSQETQSTQEDLLKNARPKSTERKSTKQTHGVAWTKVFLGHKATMVVTLRTHSGNSHSALS